MKAAGEIYKSTTSANNLNKSNSPNECKKISNGSLYLAVITCNLLSFTTGFAFRAIFYFLHKKNENNVGGSSILEEGIWLYRLGNIGGIIGAIGAGLIVGRIGRKRALLSITCPMFISFVLFAFCETPFLLYFAQFLYGFGFGALCTVMPIYVGEIATDKNRGAMGCLISLFFTAGAFLAYLVKPYFSIQLFYLFCCAQLIVFFLMFCLWNPESPQFLAFIHDERLLEASLRQLRNTSGQTIQNEIASINRTLHCNEDQISVSGALFQNIFWKGLTISIGSICFLCLLHINITLVLYLVTDSNLVDLPTTTFVIVIVFNIFAVFGIEKIRRSSLLFISVISSNVAIITLYLYILLPASGKYFYHWIPIQSLTISAIAVGVGSQPLPWVLMGELFSYNLKSISCALTTISFFIAQDITMPIFDRITQVLSTDPALLAGFPLPCIIGTNFLLVVALKIYKKSPKILK